MVGIIVYENLLNFLKEASSEDPPRMYTLPPKPENQELCGLHIPSPLSSEVREVLHRYLCAFTEIMRMDAVTALVHSQKSYRDLLPLADELGLQHTVEIDVALQQDEKRITELLQNISNSSSNSANAKTAVLRLKGDEAQAFLDVIDKVLKRENISGRVQRLMFKLSQSSDRFPNSLFISGISQCDRFYRERGGFGEIYRASYKGLFVALKRPSVSLTAEVEEQRKAHLRFCQEVLTWQQLRHDFIVPLLGIDRETFSPYLAMISPWMEQGTILNYLKKNGIDSVDRLLSDVAQGLMYLHSMKVVHGDLRGANILITDDFHACLTDFGLAAFSDAVETGNPSTSNRAGSLQWMAPELIDPKRFGHERFVRTTASDIYSLACVCLELYTGKPPFSGLSEGFVLLQIVSGQRPARPDGLISDILWEYIAKLWAEDAQVRPTATSIVKFLMDPCSDEQLADPPVIPDPPLSAADHSIGETLAVGIGKGSSAGTIISTSSYASTNSEFWVQNFPRRFFILKSPNEHELDMSVQTGTWATQNHNERILFQAYRTSQDVFLIFSVNKSNEFYGYARMEGPITRNEPLAHLPPLAEIPTACVPDEEFQKMSIKDLPAVPQNDDDPQPLPLLEAGDLQQGKVFRVSWCSTARVPFLRTRNIRNPWNHNREVKQSRDGTELEPGAGTMFLGLWQSLKTTVV
ncbi:kinase-like domain-containing protein [Mycena rosella]|uniref:Kinase-like domain-containing protein n=1 Tax=Mycena rosella TaxID=1033263 RepID=A0AAD7D7T4_MYCRO|nr:kinase-like domain-containing protein [Mycena rosella]